MRESGKPASESVSILPGSERADRAVIAFAGVQAMLGGIELAEFAKTLTAPGAAAASQKPVAFVREQPARWYNSLDPALLERFVGAQAERKIVTLGNSMGGFGALLYTMIFQDIRRSISFCPQYSVHPDHCPWERRWRDQVADIDAWRFETCLPGGSEAASSECDHVLFCGKEEPDDLRHAELIVSRASRPAAAFLVHDCGHDVARALKRRAVLVPLLDLLIDGLAPPGDIAAYLAGQGIAFDLLSNGDGKVGQPAAR